MSFISVTRGKTGPYSSQDPAVIKAHMMEAWTMKAAMVLSWWGRTGGDSQKVNTDYAVEKVVEIAENVLENAKSRDATALDPGLIAFHLEPYEGRNISTVRSDLHYLSSKYNHSPALVRVSRMEKSKPLPLFYVYDRYTGMIFATIGSKSRIFFPEKQANK